MNDNGQAMIDGLIWAEIEQELRVIREDWLARLVSDNAAYDQGYQDGWNAALGSHGLAERIT